jgi:hypothetical protein
MFNLLEIATPIADAFDVPVEKLIENLAERGWDFSNLDITNEKEVNFCLRVVNGYAQNIAEGKNPDGILGGVNLQKIKFRPHRGSLFESMETVCEVSSLAELVKVIRDSREGWPDQNEVTMDNIKLESYGFDSRINWDTYIVSICNKVVGFSDGKFI